MLATGFCLTACSKKEEPKTQTETTEQNPSNAQLHPLTEQPATAQPAPPPAMAASEPAKHNNDMMMADDDTPPPPRPHRPKRHHEQPKSDDMTVQREFTEHTTTEIRREYKKPQSSENISVDTTSTTVDAPKPIHKVKADVAEKPKKSNANLTQDDAVAAAIAAAKPAL